MMKQLTALGVAAGMATILLPSQPVAAQETDTFLIQKADDKDLARTRIRNGIEVLRPTDEEHTPEQAAFAFDPVNKDVGIVVMMNTGQLDGPLGPNQGDTIEVGNIQGACLPIRMVRDATTTSGIALQPVVSEFKYVSQRRSDENRAYHHPGIQALGNNLFALTANWDRNSSTNTERYMQVVDQNCNLLPLTANVTLRENNTSAMIMAKNNDNCSGRQAGGGSSIFRYASGKVGYMSAELCNGNGRDDGWANYLEISCAPDGSTCDIQKKFDTSFITREERSRGRCEQMDLAGGDGLPDTSICCGTEGNSQPQREGVWCAAVDHSSGDLLWKERVAYRGLTADGRRTYAMRMKMRGVTDISGRATGQVMLQWNMHRGNNNDNRKGGYTDAIQMATATPSRTGLNMGTVMDVTQAAINSQAEITHATMFQSFTGTPANPVPVFSFLTPNHNGGGGVNSRIMNLAYQNNALVEIATTRLAGPADSQKYSKYLGNNPNDQGRNYIDCHVVPNPYMTDSSGPASGVPVFNMCAMTGKLTSAGIPSLKPDLFFEVWATVKPEAAPDPDPTPNPDPNPTPNPDPNPNPEPTPNPNPGTTLGGCSAGNGMGGSGALLLLGLAVLGLRRRRAY